MKKQWLLDNNNVILRGRFANHTNTEIIILQALISVKGKILCQDPRNV